MQLSHKANLLPCPNPETSVMQTKAVAAVEDRGGVRKTEMKSAAVDPERI